MAEGYDNTNLISHNFEKVGNKWMTWATYDDEETILSYTIPESGLYQFVVQFIFNSNTVDTYTHELKIKIDGRNAWSFQIQSSSDNFRIPICCNFIYYVNANQTITVTCEDGHPTAPISVRMIDLNSPSSSYAIKLK